VHHDRPSIERAESFRSIVLTEAGHRRSNPRRRRFAAHAIARALRAIAAARSANANAPAHVAGYPASPSIRPLCNAERIAADRQKITDGGVLDHIRAIASAARMLEAKSKHLEKPRWVSLPPRKEEADTFKKMLGRGNDGEGREDGDYSPF
jgi:hypothetical protein